MSLVVRHDQKNSALDAAVVTWLAEQQQQQAAREQAPALPNLQDMLQAAVRGGPGGRPVAVADPTAPPSYRTASESPPSYRTRSYSDGGGDYGASAINRSLLGGQIQSALTDQRFQNQDALAQERYAQQAQLQNDRLARQQQEAAIRDADMMSRQFSDDLPNWIVQGISSGRLRYSPAQLRERQDLFDSIDKINSDDRFTPEQRANFVARQRERIRAIDMAPQEVPPNEWPQSPQEQANQISWDETDPASGIKVRKYLGSRNGTPQPELDPVSKVHLDDWADERKYQRQLQLKQFELAHKPDDSSKEASRVRSEQMRLQRYKDTKIRDYNKAVDQYKQAMDDLRTLNTNPPGKIKDAKGNPIELSTGEVARTADSALADINRLQQDMADLDNQIAELHASDTETMGGSPWQTFDPSVHGASTPDLSQAAPLGDMPPPHEPQTVNGRVVVNSEDEARALNLQPGTPIITSQGRTGIWQP